MTFDATFGFPTLPQASQTLKNGSCPGWQNGVIALEGNGQRPSHRGSGINADGVQFTLNCIEQHGVAYGIGNGQVNTACASMHAKEVAQTLDHMNDVQRVMLSKPEGQGYVNNSVIECAETVPFVKTTHARGKDGEGERWEECEVVGTRNVFDVGESCAQEVVVTNSNGGDVMPTINANEAKLGGDNQHITGGGTLSMNFEMYDVGKDVGISLCAKRAHDTMVVQ